MQSIPLGSSVEKTKQLNAALKFSPQGPWAMPPRHGQSQLISPVSGLKAPSCAASCSSASAEPANSSVGSAGGAISFFSWGVTGTAAALGAGVGGGAAAAPSRRFFSIRASTVGRSASENGDGAGPARAVSTCCQLAVRRHSTQENLRGTSSAKIGLVL